MNTAIAFIVVFGVLVFFHELGHLYFAKRAGILCREFAIGFGPKIFSFTKNETVYTIRLLPLGGYVRMAGEDPETIELKPGTKVALLLNRGGAVEKIVLNNIDRYPNARILEIEHADLEHKLTVTGYEEYEDAPQTFAVDEKARYVTGGEEVQIAPYHRQFTSKSLGQRALTIFAGPAMNFILAFILFMIIGLVQGIPVDRPEIGQLVENGVADKAGLQEGDEIRTINKVQMQSWKDVTTLIRKNPGNELTMDITRDNQHLTVSVIPAAEQEGNEEVGRIGVYPPVEKSLLGSVKLGFEQTIRMTQLVFVSLVQLITGQFSIDALSGPVGIYNLTGEVAKSGLVNLLGLTAALSVNLGLFNLLPIPALDGGRLMFFLVEALRGKPLDRQKEGMVHFVGFALLMLLMLVVTWNDIKKFFL
ncbi:RIP metalloprotease RseP [Ectobacillus antri]|uniref:Zinc metalloprotease n=1 Tax=Ectobacillus antri TaxID=2486280 RepID=A0ABT6GZV9_9BACI|nr:RIP metalloprotease RseP [Ectobacillus antri]MDG4655934.1 RIP metalloprotease RseP [Ectobacillus antri]MDG5752609.1 RIP metalloprotease RseP [Ectobacillus antri]